MSAVHPLIAGFVLTLLASSPGFAATLIDAVDLRAHARDNYSGAVDQRTWNSGGPLATPASVNVVANAGRPTAELLGTLTSTNLYLESRTSIGLLSGNNSASQVAWGLSRVFFTVTEAVDYDFTGTVFRFSADPFADAAHDVGLQLSTTAGVVLVDRRLNHTTDRFGAFVDDPTMWNRSYFGSATGVLAPGRYLLHVDNTLQHAFSPPEDTAGSGIQYVNLSLTPVVPEPSTMGVVGLALLAVARQGSRRRGRHSS